MLSTPISPQRVRRVQSADTGQRSVFSFSPNIIHPSDMPKTPEHSQTARQATKTNPRCWIVKRCSLRPDRLDNLFMYSLFKTELMRFFTDDKHGDINTSSPHSFWDYLKQMRPLLKEASNSLNSVFSIVRFPFFSLDRSS